MLIGFEKLVPAASTKGGPKIEVGKLFMLE
jgi:hypothetical protein